MASSNPLKILIAQFIIIITMSGGGRCVIEVTNFFPEKSHDLKSIKWYHAANSLKKLTHAIEDDSVDMIEADIVMGTVFQSPDGAQIPIMSHPPHKTSDLSFQDFIIKIAEGDSQGRRKGIKLDFKEIETVDIVLRDLERLESEDKLNIPVWLNADILPGPIKSTKVPLDPKIFIPLAKRFLPKATLSVGWTTRFGRDDIRANPNNTSFKTIRSSKGYLREQLMEMIDILSDPEMEWEGSVTFPIRAGLAVVSEGDLQILTTLMPNPELVTYTIWSVEDDPVDMKKLNDLIIRLGETDKVFIDLPFSLKSGPTIVPDSILERSRTHHHPHSLQQPSIQINGSVHAQPIKLILLLSLLIKLLIPF